MLGLAAAPARRISAGVSAALRPRWTAPIVAHVRSRALGYSGGRIHERAQRCDVAGRRRLRDHRARNEINRQAVSAAHRGHRGDPSRLHARRRSPDQNPARRAHAICAHRATSRDQIVALGPNARPAAIDQTLPEGSGSRSHYLRRAVVRNLTDGQDILTFPDRELTIGPGGISDADGSSRVVAGFDAAGLRLAMARDAPNCPMTVATTMAWVPVSVPSCPERWIEIEIWDLEKRKKVEETGFVMTPESAAKWPPAALSIGVGFARTVPLLVDLPDPSGVSVTGATFHSVEIEGERTLKVNLTRHRVALNGDDLVRTAACERLPRAFAEPDLSAWMVLVPKEGFRPICPRAPAAAQRP
jgi:hypothetical protein